MFQPRIRQIEPVAWSPVIGVVRAILAFASLLTLSATPTDSLFQPLWGIGPQPVCKGINAFNLFCAFGPDNLELSKLVTAAALLLIISGYLPQITSLLHYWISFSLFNGIAIPDGGDQITVVLTFLLIPICITDSRRNHWSSWSGSSPPAGWRCGWAVACLIGIKIQVSIVYLQSCIEKTAQTEWATGNNLYYTASGVFGFSNPVRALLAPLLENEATVSLLTWSVLALEFVIAVTLLTPAVWRPFLFLSAALFHGGIAFLMGLWSFALAMIAADLILTLPLAGVAFSSGFSLIANKPDSGSVKEEQPTEGKPF
ncbi:sporulation-delaying protein SdpB family protein [Arthrobacter methylotrophus]|uniref:Sporulation-delaying protein SdpB family protein n=1 Tax=Arthrobacter methylotrophus TaxID=121291 RepID=A0ABV5URZ5_9MICC